eukprot:11157817-Lingulodinium_polyedra.AAC.1
MAGAPGPRTAFQRASGMPPRPHPGFSGSRRAKARAILEPLSPPCLAVWWRERKGSTAGPMTAAQ